MPWSRVAACALLVLVAATGARGAKEYFPEGVSVPQVDRSCPPHLNPADAHWKTQGLPDHNARFLPANYSYARWISCPWACFASPAALSRRLASPRAARNAACALEMRDGRHGRRSVLGASLGLLIGAATGGVPRVSAGTGVAVSIKDVMDAQKAEREAKQAVKDALPKRPTELRDRETCFVWNGEKRCTSCVKGCEEYKKTFKTLDCSSYCTVEYGAPKPTDEESISFGEFVEDVNKGEITFVDFYGPAGDKAYATMASGTTIRIGEGFPVEIGNEQSSPLQVVRLLNSKSVPYKFHILDNVKYRKMGAP